LQNKRITMCSHIKIKQCSDFLQRYFCQFYFSKKTLFEYNFRVSHSITSSLLKVKCNLYFVSRKMGSFVFQCSDLKCRFTFSCVSTDLFVLFVYYRFNESEFHAQLWILGVCDVCVCLCTKCLCIVDELRACL